MQAPPSSRILIVDDDDLFAESLQQNLQDAGFAVSTFPQGKAVLDYLAEGGGGDLMLLDWKMPGMNGIEVLKQLRERRHPTPVIFLTVLSDQIYEEAGLLGGAVDFVEKSRSFSILLKRIQLILGGARKDPPPKGSGPNGAVSSGPLKLIRDAHRATWREKSVELTLTEFRVIDLLVSKSGADVSYREIYDSVRGEGFIAGTGDDGYRANVRTLIKRIRQKFRAADDDFEAIENYPGFGYRWRTDDG